MSDHTHHEENNQEEDAKSAPRVSSRGIPSPSPLSTPIAIIIAGLLIAGAVIYAPQFDGGRETGGTGLETPESQNGGAADAVENVRQVGGGDHILGSPEAAVKVIEFSDTECPFCKQFHGTMHKIIDEYGGDGRVAWVYRHFPLDGLHKKARKEAEATECAGELGGKDAFWAYLDRLFEVTPSNDGLDPAELPRIAEHVGLDGAEFSRCLESGRHADLVASNLEDAIRSGGAGTPYSIVIAPSGKKYTIPGALPYEDVRRLIETALQEK